MLSIIICTYERSTYLRQCLASLAVQPGIGEQEVIVVDNSPGQSTRSLAAEFPTFRFVAEPQPGLSHARNRGMQAAQGNWLLFLDDDVRCPPDFLERALYNVTQNDFTAIGGYYVPWYPVARPDWLSADYGRKALLLPERGPLVPGQQGFLSGGIFLIRKSVLVQLGGFVTHRGMSREIGYGEEDDLQLRLHRAGFFVGFDPQWWLEHAVLPHKLSPWWQLQSAYARRRDAARPPTSAPHLLWQSTQTGLTALVKLPWRTYRLVTDPAYYWQNLLLGTGVPLARRVGDWVRLLGGEE